MIIVILACTNGIYYFIGSIAWIAFSRLCFAFVLFTHARRIDMSYTFLIYINQVMTTVTKIYILFRLPQQRWKNRGDQSSSYNSQHGWRYRSWVATYLSLFYCMCCLIFALILMQCIFFPTMGDIQTIY